MSTSDFSFFIVSSINAFVTILFFSWWRKFNYFSSMFYFGMPVGLVLGMCIYSYLPIKEMMYQSIFIGMISNVISILILGVVISMKIEKIIKTHNSKRLTRAVRCSMMGSIQSLSGIVAYQGMRSSFAMPMLNQDVSVRTTEEHIFQSAIHPTTGFPMSNEGFDIAGNPIGMAMHPSAHTIFQPNINPASGMPMMNDSLDIHGSPYGVVGMNDYHSGMSSGYNNDHYAHSSSSIDHYNQH
ncbi:MAG: hypothetical protein RSD49_02400 [Hafnia sp.]